VVFFVTIISSFVGCPFNNQSSVYHKKISFWITSFLSC
jgi:hypothetical protein